MPKIKRKKAYESLIVKAFGGLRDDAESAQEGALVIRNFQFSPAKTLEKRPGYRKTRQFTQNIRSFWHSTLAGYPGDFVLLGANIFYCPEIGNPVSFGSVADAQGAAKFFVYRDFLYLATSCSLYVANLERERFSEACGYAPVFGENWNPTTGTGEVKEPLNLFSRRIRVHYLCPTGTVGIRLPFPGESVESVTENGVALPYQFTEGTRTVNVSYTQSPTEIEIAYTMESEWSPLRDAIGSCTIPFSFRKDDREYLYLTGGEAGFRAYSAAKVTGEQLAACKSRFPDSDPLYFKASGVLFLGDTAHPLTAFARQNNRVIAFGTSGAWSIFRGDESDTVEAYPLESCPGCISREGAFSVGDELILLTSSGLCALRANSADKDRFAVELLSGQITNALGNFDWANALILYDPIKNRVLLRDPGENRDGLLYVYDRTLKRWTAWDGIRGSAFLASPEGNIVFWREKCVYAFDDTIHTDLGAAFDCVYESGALSFDSPEERKRSLRAFCEVVPDGGERFGLEIISEHGGLDRTWLCQAEDFPSHFECRLPSGRFRNIRYRLTAYGSGQIKIHRLGCCCNL